AYWLSVGEGPGDEKVQTFLSYSLRFTGTVLALLTMFLSVGSVTRDIQRREIFTITTKPISRGQFLAGKALGLIVLNALLLGACGAVIFGCTHWLARTAPRDEAEQRRLDELVLIARRSVWPELVGVDQTQIEKEIEELVAQRIEQARKELVDASATELMSMRLTIQEETRNQVVLRYRSAAPGGHVIWRFQGVEPSSLQKGPLYLRYQYETAPDPDDSQVYGEWYFGPTPEVMQQQRPVQTYNATRAVHEGPVDAQALSPAGQLYVAFQNPILNYPSRVIFPLPEEDDVSIELLYVAGGFTGNFLRALAGIWLRLVFLALVGVAMGAWLSFPVAVLVVIVIFALGIASNFILTAVKWGAGQEAASLTGMLMQVLPRLAAYDPVGKVDRGRLVPWELLGRQLFMLIGIKGGLVTLFGYLIFRFRELARVTV
ncbi:MAG: ABC transporter permease, partial [Sedimentisphaerales bacterium]|nr:ABC transporter permease [Sedimentisphaerales bacterium]